MSPRLLSCLVLFLTANCYVQSSGFDPLDYVDPLIGSAKDGHVFAGASLPYGMAKAVADTDSNDNQGGFVYGENMNVTGFSAMHDSGTGGSPSLGIFPIFPLVSCPNNDINACTFSRAARKVKYIQNSVRAAPGYFGLTLANGVSAEMTTSKHAALFQFHFPKGADSSPVILLDLADLSDSRQDNGSITVDPHSGRMAGSAVFKPSFGSGQYQAYFCADFVAAGLRDSGIWVDSRGSADVHNLTISRSINGKPLPGGGFVRFQHSEHTDVRARIGVSLMSAEQACDHMESEIPDLDLGSLQQQADCSWREKFAPVEISTRGQKDNELITNFYSGIYRTMINPQDYTGENPLWDSREPYFDSFYCLWDSFRSQIPFLTILDPVEVTRMIRSLIDTYKHDGWLPDCRMTLSRGYTQGGSNADVVLADAFVKGLDQGIDWSLGHAAVVKDAEEEPFDWCCRGRGGLDSWKRLGYIPVSDFDYRGFGTMTRSISRTLEYSYNDFCIAQIARGFAGHGVDVAKYEASSNNWANLYREDMPSLVNGTDTGFVGFFQPRHLNETWGYQNPLTCSNIDTNPRSVCSLQNNAAETFESSIWEYSFFVPHDQARLISMFGGPKMFVKRLDYLHDQNITLISNEPSFLTVFKYHYAGRPGLSSKRVRYYVPRSFSPKPDGLPGNDDSGAMGSFLAFSMMGLFPNPGQDVYLITTPFFESVSVTSPITNNTATIRIQNWDPEMGGIYIQAAWLDGVPYHRNWIDHSFFLKGKELVLEIGEQESSWGTRVEDLPPSLSEYMM